MTTFGRALAVTIINATPQIRRRASHIPEIFAGLVLLLLFLFVLV